MTYLNSSGDDNLLSESSKAVSEKSKNSELNYSQSSSNFTPIKMAAGTTAAFDKQTT